MSDRSILQQLFDRISRLEEAEALLPSGMIIVERDRFERLREFTEAALEWDDAGMDPWHPEKREATKPRLFAARAALLPTDIDPLP